MWDAAGIRPDAAYAESSLIPSAPNALVLVLDEGTLHVSRPDRSAYALDAESLQVAFDLALGEQTEAGEHVTFYASPADYAAHKDAIEGLRARTATLQVKLLPDGTLPLLAAQVPAARPINLLQGAYAAPTSFGSQLQAVAPARRTRAARRWSLPRRAGLQALAAAPGRAAARRADHPDLQPDPARATDRRSARADPGRAGSRRRREQCPAARDVVAGASHRTGAGHARRSNQLPGGRARAASRRTERRGARRHQAGHEPRWRDGRTAVREPA